MEPRKFKDFVYSAFAGIGKTLSSPKRIELLDLLTQGRKSVEMLSSETGMSTANTSKHLQTLLESRLVTYKKDKNYVYYELAGDEVRGLILALRSTAEDRNFEVNKVRHDYITKENSLKTVPLSYIKEQLAEGHITLLDVRAQHEFESEHLPGALSVPVDKLREKLDIIPKDKPVIAYCRGPYCVYASEAVEQLRESGYDAAVLDSGINEWKQAEGKEGHNG